MSERASRRLPIYATVAAIGVGLPCHAAAATADISSDNGSAEPIVLPRRRSRSRRRRHSPTWAEFFAD